MIGGDEITNEKRGGRKGVSYEKKATSCYLLK